VDGRSWPTASLGRFSLRPKLIFQPVTRPFAKSLRDPVRKSPVSYGLMVQAARRTPKVIAVTIDSPAASVVRYWRAVEMFSPQTLRDRPSSDNSVYQLEPDRVPPWHPDHPIARIELKPDEVWQHSVYGGVFGLEKLRDILIDFFGDDKRYRDERLDGETAIFACTLDSKGRLIADSGVLSACAWAVGRTARPGPGSSKWLDEREWELAQTSFLTTLEALGTPNVPKVRDVAATGGGARARVAAAKASTAGTAAVASVAPPISEPGIEEPEDVRRPLTATDLVGFTERIAKGLTIDSLLAPSAVWVKSRKVSAKRSDAESDQDFLNSFIFADLGRIEKAIRRGDWGAALDAYLLPHGRIDVSRRIDVRECRDRVLAEVSPDRTPLGRWVTDVTKPLALSQQFGVNQVLAGIAGPGGTVSAVNGPPGTGKTTMLRDVTAALVVERAARLACLPRPEDAFSGQEQVWSSGSGSYRVNVLRPDLVGFEVVVACAGNGAAENITREFPSHNVIDKQWYEAAREVDYFAELASIVLELPSNGLQKPAWAAVSAALGKMDNRRTFRERYWWGVRREEEERAHRHREKPTRSGEGLHDVLQRQESSGVLIDWPAAVDRFNNAREEVECLALIRSDAAKSIPEAAVADARINDLSEKLNKLNRRVSEARLDVSACIDALAGAEADAERVRSERADHACLQPRFWVTICTRGRAARDWHDTDRKLATTLNDATSALAGARVAADRADRRVRTLEEACQDIAVCLDRARKDAQQAASTLAGAIAKWPRHVPTPEVLGNPAQVELLAPWADAEFAAARTRLFLEALRLHKAFLLATAKTMRKNLRAAFQLVNGSIPPDLDPAVAKAAWRCLFLAVPVVSTTFASFDKVFGHFGPEDLGCVFIDEAGQATPQCAVGPLWRAQNAVIVGDPLQLEPIVSLPWTVQQALRRHYDVAEEWLPGATSVQRLADRLAVHGTYLHMDSREGRQQVWVGSPLRVHRRCDDPMFTLSNTIAYDGLMVFGTPPIEPENDPYRGLPPSSWIDVRSPQAVGNWIPEEGRRLVRVIKDLIHERDVDPAKIRVISPFRGVADRCEQECLGLLPRKSVGTVHTMQGKEADIVFLVLGSGPQRPGARAWAAEKPNLLNVAVSRAKRRLYVIGSRELWSKRCYFSALARLPDPRSARVQPSER
jgi:hypothetical protein